MKEAVLVPTGGIATIRGHCNIEGSGKRQNGSQEAEEFGACHGGVPICIGSLGTGLLTIPRGPRASKSHDNLYSGTPLGNAKAGYCGELESNGWRMLQFRHFGASRHAAGLNRMGQGILVMVVCAPIMLGRR